MTHHAGGRTRRAKAPLTTGRLALWLGFWLIIAILIMATTVALAGNGATS